MNDYRVKGTGRAGELIADITAIDEKDARRAFRARYKGEGIEDIIDVTMIRENTPATKAQEREALEKIKAIVATLGPRSYVGTALDGCLEDAEVNIENDFGDSMKARWQDAEKRVAEAVKETARLRDEKKLLADSLANARKTIESMKGRTINQADATDITDAIGIIGEKRSALEAEIEDAAARIVEAAGEPESEAFKKAVSDHRAAKKEMDYCNALISRLETVRARWPQ